MAQITDRSVDPYSNRFNFSGFFDITNLPCGFIDGPTSKLEVVESVNLSLKRVQMTEC